MIAGVQRFTAHRVASAQFLGAQVLQRASCCRPSHVLLPAPSSSSSSSTGPGRASLLSCRSFQSASAALSSMVSAAPTAPRVAIERVPCLRDNYVWLLHDDESGLTLVVDPSDAQPVAQVLAAKGWNLDFILNTHHHSDHTGGNLQLKRAHQCTIVGPKAEQARIPGIDIAVGDGDVWQFGSHQFRVFDTPGHTAGHCAFWAPSLAALFPGDTLFVLGCGRLFEGNPQQMWTSLSKLLPLPDDTRLFCAHEYSQANARWAVSIDPTNQALLAQVAEIDHLRSQGLSTVPGLLGQEKATNPCLRPHDGAIRQRLGVSAGARDWEAFAAIRGHKDTF